MMPRSLARLDRGTSEIGEAPVLRGQVLEAGHGHRGVAQVVVAVVGQSQVARAKVVVRLEDVQVPAEGMAVLDPDERRAPPLAVNAPHVRGRARQTDGLRVLHVGHAADGGKLGERVGHGPRVARHVALALPHVNDEKHRIQPAALHPHQIDLAAARLGLPGIVGLGTEIGRYIHVGVHGEDTRVDGRGAGEEVGFGVCRQGIHGSGAFSREQRVGVCQHRFQDNTLFLGNLLFALRQ